MDDSLTLLGLSPFQLKGVKQSQRKKYAEKMSTQVATVLQEQFVEVSSTSAGTSSSKEDS